MLSLPKALRSKSHFLFSLVASTSFGRWQLRLFIGIAVFLVVYLIIPPLLPAPISNPATQYPSASTVVPTPSNQSVFKTNFEDNIIQGIGIYDGTWQIVDDGTGNHVFQNNVSSDWPGFFIGSSISDGSIEFSVKYLDYDLSQDNGSGRVNLFFRTSNVTLGGYVFSFNPYVNRTEIAYVGNDNNWSPPFDGGMSTLFVEKNIWYKVRVELKGSSISIYLDGTPIALVKDNRSQKGDVVLSTGPNTEVQFDNISIIYSSP